MPDDFSDSGIQLHAQAIGDFLARPGPGDRLREWAQTVAGPVVGGRLVVGSIVWAKAMGRPQTAKMCDGFAIGIWSKRSWLDYQSGRDVSLKATFFPTKSDATNDGGPLHRVIFMLSSEISGPQVVEVKFAGPKEWVDATAAESKRLRNLKPHVREIDKSVGEPLFVDPFEVVSKPIGPSVSDPVGQRVVKP